MRGRRTIAPMTGRVACSAVMVLVLRSSMALAAAPAPSLRGPLAFASLEGGFATFSMQHLNRYYIDRKVFFSDHLDKGFVGEIEGGAFIHRAMQVGVVLAYAAGSSESDEHYTLDSLVWYDFWYCDAAFLGGGLLFRYFPYMSRSVRISASCKVYGGRGATHVGYGRRPDERLGKDYGDLNHTAPCFGASLCAGGSLCPLPHIWLGVETGYRLLRSATLQNSADGSAWLREGHDINLDFSGFVVRGKVSIEL